MAQKAFDGVVTYDWELWVGRKIGAATEYTFTQIFGMKDLPFPDQMPESLDVTHINSPGNTKEKIGGMMDSVEVSQEKQYWPDDAGDRVLLDLAALSAAGNAEDVLIEFNIKPDGTSERRTYRGHVLGYNPTGAVGEIAMANLSMEVFDRQAANERTIA